MHVPMLDSFTFATSKLHTLYADGRCLDIIPFRFDGNAGYKASGPEPTIKSLTYLISSELTNHSISCEHFYPPGI